MADHGQVLAHHPINPPTVSTHPDQPPPTRTSPGSTAVDMRTVTATLRVLQDLPIGSVVTGHAWAAVKAPSDVRPDAPWLVTGQFGAWRDREVARMMDVDRRRNHPVKVIRP